MTENLFIRQRRKRIESTKSLTMNILMIFFRFRSFETNSACIQWIPFAQIKWIFAACACRLNQEDTFRADCEKVISFPLFSIFNWTIFTFIDFFRVFIPIFGKTISFHCQYNALSWALNKQTSCYFHSTENRCEEKNAERMKRKCFSFSSSLWNAMRIHFLPLSFLFVSLAHFGTDNLNFNPFICLTFIVHFIVACFDLLFASSNDNTKCHIKIKIEEYKNDGLVSKSILTSISCAFNVFDNIPTKIKIDRFDSMR